LVSILDTIREELRAVEYEGAVEDKRTVFCSPSVSAKIVPLVLLATRIS